MPSKEDDEIASLSIYSSANSRIRAASITRKTACDSADSPESQLNIIRPWWMTEFVVPNYEGNYYNLRDNYDSEALASSIYSSSSSSSESLRI